MESFTRLIILTIACGLMCLIVRQYKADYALLAEISAICAVGVYALNIVLEILKDFESNLGLQNTQPQLVEILIKALFIAVLTGVAGDICRDSGNTALAGAIEFAGKITIMILSMPLVKAVGTLAAGLINS